MNSFSTSPHLSLSVSISCSPSRLGPISLCLSLCLSQPITGWLQVLNPRRHHRLVHYIAALNLSLLPSSSVSSLPLSPFSPVFPHSSFCHPCFSPHVGLTHTFIFCFHTFFTFVVSLFVCVHFFLLFIHSASFLLPQMRLSHPQHPLPLSPLHSIPSSLSSLAPSFCKLLQLNCPFSACRQRWY